MKYRPRFCVGLNPAYNMSINGNARETLDLKI